MLADGEEPDLSSASKAQLFAKYVDASRLAHQMRDERDEANETLNALLAELQVAALALAPLGTAAAICKYRLRPRKQ